MADFAQYNERFKQARLEKAFKLQGEMEFQGLKIKIENKRGSIRRWKTQDGESGETKMYTRYGYIAKTLGNDGDAVDVYISDINPLSEKVFVIHQKFPKTGEYDEDKCMLGFNTEKQAIDAYLRQYDDPEFFDSVEEFTIDEFKQALKDLRGHKIEKTAFEKAYEYLQASVEGYLLDHKGNPILTKADAQAAALQYAGIRQHTRELKFKTIANMSKQEIAKAILAKDRFVLSQLYFKNKK